MALLSKAEFRKMSDERYSLSNDQAKSLLSKYNLGDLACQKFIGGNFTNSVFECQTLAGDHFIFKVQYRTGNRPLSVDRDVTLLLQDVLPVSPVCILDEDCDIISYPTLILTKLTGDLAQSIFENTTHHARLKVSHLLGEIIAKIHTAPVSENQVSANSLFSLNGWRNAVALGLLEDEGLRQAIDQVDNEFYTKFQHLLDQVPDIHFDESFRLVWGDPAFHNFNVQVEGDDIRLSGVFDFQTAGWGNPVFDRFYLDGNFGRAQADGLYQIPDYLKACYEGYADCGLIFPEISDAERALRGVILKANGPKWWWTSAKVLPPFVANTLNGLLKDLKALKESIK